MIRRLLLAAICSLAFAVICQNQSVIAQVPMDPVPMGQTPVPQSPAYGASWGGQAPKQVVRQILKNTDKASIIAQLKSEIRTRISSNPHAQE